MLRENGEDRPDVKNTREYHAILLIEEDLEDGQACGSMIILLCKIFDCMLSDLCDIRDDFVPKVIFENPEIIYFVNGERLINKLKLLEKQQTELTEEQRAYLHRAESQTRLDEPYLRLPGKKIARICEWIGCDSRYLCYLSENQIKKYIENNENRFHFVDGNEIKKIRMKQNLTIKEVVQDIKKYGKFSKTTEKYFLEIEEGLVADMPGNLLLVLCKVLNCKSIEIYRSKTQSHLLDNPENFFIVRGERLRKIRQTNGYSIRELENLTNISKSSINRIEKSGESFTKIRNIENLADVLNCSTEFLMGTSNWIYGQGVINEYGREQRFAFITNRFKLLLDSDIKEISPVNYSLLLEFIEILKYAGPDPDKRKTIESKLSELKGGIPNVPIQNANKSLCYSIIRKIDKEGYIYQWYNKIFKMIYSKYAVSVRQAATIDEVEELAKEMIRKLQNYKKTVKKSS